MLPLSCGVGVGFGVGFSMVWCWHCRLCVSEYEDHKVRRILGAKICVCGCAGVCVALGTSHSRQGGFSLIFCAWFSMVRDLSLPSLMGDLFISPAWVFNVGVPLGGPCVPWHPRPSHRYTYVELWTCPSWIGVSCGYVAHHCQFGSFALLPVGPGGVLQCALRHLMWPRLDGAKPPFFIRILSSYSSIHI